MSAIRALITTQHGQIVGVHLAFVHSCIMNIGEPGTSFCTCTKFVLSSSRSLAMRMPLPPPPSEALIMTGKPIEAADAMASFTLKMHALLNTSCGMTPCSFRPDSMPSPDQGMEGTLAVCARMLADTLSPRAAITGPVGPMNYALVSEAWLLEAHTGAPVCPSP